MNTNPQAKRILCYGDSLTNGSVPLGDRVYKKGRFSSDERWTCLLQNKLGTNYEVIEEGLGGRTTNLDDPNSPGRNGLTFFPVCLGSHQPLDVLILLLGTNDLKDRFARTPNQVAQTFVEYKKVLVDSSADWGVEAPKIILISPPLILQNHVPVEWDLSQGAAKSALFASEYQKVASEIGADFVDLSSVNPSSVDGIHLGVAGNVTVADLVYSKLINL